MTKKVKISVKGDTDTPEFRRLASLAGLTVDNEEFSSKVPQEDQFIEYPDPYTWSRPANVKTHNVPARSADNPLGETKTFKGYLSDIIRNKDVK